MGEKVTGYTLLTVGLIVIAFAVISVYSVFTGRIVPFEIFKFDGVTLPVSLLLGGEGQLPVGDAEVEIFPSEVLNQTSNMLAHLFLMGFVSSIGFKVALVGANLLRPIYVKVDGQKIKSSILEPKK